MGRDSIMTGGNFSLTMQLLIDPLLPLDDEIAIGAERLFDSICRRIPNISTADNATGASTARPPSLDGSDDDAAPLEGRRRREYGIRVPVQFG